jgi:N6-adenosine-specific RNA methylase IME4
MSDFLGYPPHPAAELFPMMGKADRANLKASMAEHGWTHDEPLILIETPGGAMVLDGRNRLSVAIELGFAEERIPWRFFGQGADGEFDGDDPFSYVIRKNLPRRHLDESQRAMVAARLATMRQGERTDLEPSANLPKVDQASAADMLNVSDRSVRSAKTVQELGTEKLQEAVATGEVAVSAAALIAALPKEEQAAIIEEIANSPETKKAYASVVRKLRGERQAQKKANRKEREQQLAAKILTLPTKQYGVQLMDFEWHFKVFSEETGMDRHAANHYQTAGRSVVARAAEDERNGEEDTPSHEEVAERIRPRLQCMAPDAVVFAWLTVPHLLIGLKALELLGFEYKSHCMWPKERSGNARGTGYWFTNEHEILGVFVRGKVPCPAPGENWPSVIPSPVREHSRKPDWQYELIEDYFPNLPKIEFNARDPNEGLKADDPARVPWPRPGWDVWGNEAGADSLAKADDEAGEQSSPAEPVSRLTDGRTSDAGGDAPASPSAHESEPSASPVPVRAVPAGAPAMLATLMADPHAFGRRE